MDPSAILQPVFVVALLTLVMFLWMIVTRIPAMTKAKIDPQSVQNPSKLFDLLPPEIMRVSSNYNHLFEAPTVFYAVAISIAVLGHVDPLHVKCAWAFAIFRILHSLVQATVDIVMVRFALFLLAWMSLAIMIVRETFAMF